MKRAREILYSEVKSHPGTNGGDLIFDLFFLRKVLGTMVSPRIRSLVLRCKWVVDGGTETTRGQLLYKNIRNVELKDGRGIRTLMPGLDLAVANAAELANCRPPNLIAATTANQTQYHHIDLHPVEVQNEQDEGDHAILASDFAQNGSCIVSLDPSGTALATNKGNIDSASTFQLVADIEDGDFGDQFPRLVWQTFPITVSPVAQRFNAKGNIRWAIVYAGSGTEDDGTGLAEQKFASVDLGYGQGLQLSYLEYLYERRGIVRARDMTGTLVSDDPFVLGQAVMLAGPRPGQKIARLPDLDTFYVESDGTVAVADVPKMLVCTYTDRSPELVQASLAKPGNNPPNIDEVRRVYQQAADINGGPPASAVGRIASRLPVKLRARAGKR